VIPEAAVKSLARRLGVDAAVVDRDHALGVVLWALNASGNTPRWVFKGGTCLRKCYFGDYRFSEDLDFTVLGRLDAGAALSAVSACESAAASQGIKLLVREARVEIMNDEYGRESVEIKLPYRGALRMGSAQNVRFHLSADEEMAFDPVARPLLHSYEDAPGLACDISAYALEEILVEKLRAVAGQRRHAVARDVYDIANLLHRGVDASRALSALPGKAAYKAVDLSDAADRLLARRAEFEASWNRTLAYLVVDELGFDEAFSATARLLEQV
jgi:predicted nucleotidyltransferase component of viral defense system